MPSASYRPLAIAALVIQSLLLVLSGATMLLVSSAFCASGDLCAARGPRWYFWFAIAFALLALAVAIPAASGSRRRLRVAEASMTVLALGAVLLANGPVDVSMEVLLFLTIAVGLVVVAASSHLQGRTQR